MKNNELCAKCALRELCLNEQNATIKTDCKIFCDANLALATWNAWTLTAPSKDMRIAPMLKYMCFSERAERLQKILKNRKITLKTARLIPLVLCCAELLKKICDSLFMCGISQFYGQKEFEEPKDFFELLRNIGFETPPFKRQ